jgi:dTDP-4-amino-4,6-dideoxygalactose transaminase
MQATSERTRSVVLVHYGGRADDIETCEDIAWAAGRAVVIEDAAHAAGARYADGSRVGSRAGLCCFSFNVQKTMTTIEGGMVTTGDPKLAAKVRQIVRQGLERRGAHRDQALPGLKGTMDEVRAAIGRVQLRRLDGLADTRRSLAGRYNEALSGLDGVVTPPWGLDESVWWLYPVRALARNTLADALWNEGIETTVSYKPVHLHSYWQDRPGCERGSFPYAELLSSEVLCLPLFPAMGMATIDRVAGAVWRLSCQDKATSQASVPSVAMQSSS